MRDVVIAVTRPAGAVKATEALVRAYGGRPLVVPVFRLRPLLNVTMFRRVLRALKRRTPGCVIFMSRTAVDVLADVAARRGALDQLRTVVGRAAVLAVGPTTQQRLLQRLSLGAQVPARYTSTGLADTLAGFTPRPSEVVVFRSAKGSPTLARALHALGCRVREYRIYDAVPAPHDVQRFAKLLARGEVDATVVTSALGARILVDGVTQSLGRRRGLRLLNQGLVVAIGPESARQLEKLRVRVRATPERHLLKEALGLVAKKLGHSSGGGDKSLIGR